MRIIVYCYAFSPSIGGIETIAETLAINFTKLGHECIVITETSNPNDDNFPFIVMRKPSGKDLLKTIKSVDIVYNVELSMKFFFLTKIAGKPLVWIHNGYKLMCIDALGWYLDKPAPMKPWKSIIFYIKVKGFFFGIKEGFKLFVRRWASSRIYCNVAATQWINKRQQLKHQVQIYTPYPTERFLKIADVLEKKYDFLYVGRLVREKGVDTLLLAFKDFLETNDNKDLKLAIVGYGAEEMYFKNLAETLDISNKVDFLGSQKGQDLIDVISKCEVGVVPSYWEEPMGGISLELLAAGRMVIVSKNGGMPEVVGDAGLTFTNGDWKELSQKMNDIYNDPLLKSTLKGNRMSQLQKFNPEHLSKKYLEIFRQ